MSLRSTFLLAVFVLCCLPVAHADDAQRRLFVEALGKVEAGDAEAEDFAALRGYVLYPYLQAAELRRALRRSPGDYTNQRIMQFLDEHRDAAFAGSLRIAWLRRLADQGQWQVFLAYYPASAGEEMECLAATAKIRLKHEDALRAAESMWLAGKSRDKSCNPVFAWLSSSGHLTQALIDGRARLAMENGETSLVRYLAGKQQGAAKARSEHWLWAYGNPRDAISRLAASGDSRMDADMLADVFRRLTQLDRNRAALLYDKAMQRSAAGDVLRAQLAAYIGFRYILNREPEALQWYRRSGSVPLREIESEWRIRSAIYAEAWQDVQGWIDALDEAMRMQPRWQYWRGRALHALGKTAEAREILSGVSGLRDFYGFMAADRIGAAYAIVDRPVAADKELQQRLQARAEVRRAHELWKAGLSDKARAEWSVLLASLNDAEKLQAGVLADDWGWWSRAIVSYGQAGYWDDLGRRFPAPYRSVVQQEARRQGIDPHWVYAITRSESTFVRDARSPVGALGLMQLMPATGRQVASSEGMRWLGSAMLYEPEYNIRLGARYLADMLKRFNGHIAMATAAYNAGPRNVDKWKPARNLPADIWIETVPFGATHNYLRHVLEFTATYEWRLTGKPTRLADRLSPVTTQ